MIDMLERYPAASLSAGQQRVCREIYAKIISGKTSRSKEWQEAADDFDSRTESA
jgi:hypothetical protein